MYTKFALNQSYIFNIFLNVIGIELPFYSFLIENISIYAHSLNLPTNLPHATDNLESKLHLLEVFLF